MKDESLRISLEIIARRNIPENTNLWPRLASRIEHKDTLSMNMKWKLIWTILLVMLGLSAVTGVVYALGRMTGYLPGIGFVQTHSLRVLTAPVSQTRQGITVSIDQVIVDSERTVVVYKTEGLTISAANSKGEGAAFGSAHYLRLPDGTLWAETPAVGYAGTPEPLINDEHTQGGWPNYVRRLVYPPVPSHMNEIMLLIPILQTMPAGAAPENWTFTFHLKPAPADMTVAPVSAISPPSTPVDAAAVAGERTPPALSGVVRRNGFTFQLDNVVDLADGLIFTGSLSWDDSVFPSGKGMLSQGITPVLTDSNDRNIPVEEVQFSNGSYVDDHKMAWSVRTNRNIFSGPLVLSLQSVSATLLPPPADFELDLGSSPQVGQRWQVNRDFVFAGHTLRLLSAQLTADSNPCWKYDLVFNFASDADGISGSVNDAVPQTALEQICSGGGGGGGGLVDPGSFSTGTTYSRLPTGVRHFTISASIPYLISGPWQVSWNPPVVEASVPTSEPGACLTLDKWNQFLDRNDPVPAGLGGKILTTVNEAGLLPAIYVSNLDGTNRQKIETGGWPSLSPGGARLAYSIADGIHILDLSTGQNLALGMDGHNLIWSPVSDRIFFSTTFALYVINADGSGLEKIDTGAGEIVTSVGWLADNQTLVYSALGGDGFTFTTYNLLSGEMERLFSFQNKAGFGAISPDGQWIVFSDRVFGAQNWGIFIARLDGTERKLVAEPDVPTAFTSVWGPDGQWLILNTKKADGGQIPVLVNPFTCQGVRLQNFDSMVEGWSP